MSEELPPELEYSLEREEVFYVLLLAIAKKLDVTYYDIIDTTKDYLKEYRHAPRGDSETD